MPVDRPVSFLAVDEVQMAADPERGHFFTDRLLHARGLNETMLLGADTIRPVLNRLLPDIDMVARPRFSKPHLCRAEEGDAPAAPLGRGRLLGQRSL